MPLDTRNSAGVFSWVNWSSAGSRTWPCASLVPVVTGSPLAPSTLTVAPATGWPVWIDCTNTSWVPSALRLASTPRFDTSTSRWSDSPRGRRFSGSQLSTLSRNSPRRSAPVPSRYRPRSMAS